MWQRRVHRLQRHEEEDGRGARPVEQHAIDLGSEPVSGEGAVDALSGASVPLKVDARADPIVARRGLRDVVNAAAHEAERGVEAARRRVLPRMEQAQVPFSHCATTSQRKRSIPSRAGGVRYAAENSPWCVEYPASFMTCDTMSTSCGTI